MEKAIDLKSIAGKAPRPERRVPLVVVGAGPAGIAAAIEAARAGVEVMLVDENPIDLNLMAMDVPLYFGQRMSAAVANKGEMLERFVQTNAALSEAFDAGVDVQLGISVWGAFRKSRTVLELDGPMVGLADEEKSWLIGYDRLIVAAGARDLPLSFTGWEKAGVMGANGAYSLLSRYRAFGGRRMVILGSGNVGLQTAALAIERGVEVAGIVEVAPDVRGDAALRQQIASKGVPFYTAHTIKEARGTQEVEGIVLVQIGGDLLPIAGTEKEIACDTICVAVGLVPNVELLNLLGCQLPFQAELGGYSPAIDESMRTSVPAVFVAGDGAGFHEGMVTDQEIAVAHGRLAGLAAAASLGKADASQVQAARAALTSLDGGKRDEALSYRQMWFHSLINAGGWNVNVCQCEEVTRRELADVQPPRYLNWKSEQMSARGLKTLVKDGPVNQDQVKRLTRAGMGYCQGRRCREQVAMLLADEAGMTVGQIPLPSYRPPVRPLPLNVLWPHDEPEEMREHWPVWFGIPTQFGPQWNAEVANSEEPMYSAFTSEKPTKKQSDPLTYGK